MIEFPVLLSCLRNCRLPQIFGVAAVLVVPVLLTAILAAQGNQYPYHSERIRLTSVGTLGKSEDGKFRFPDQMTPGDLNGDGLEDVFLHLAVDSTSTSPEQPFLLLLNDGAGGLVDGTADMIAPPAPIAFGVFRMFIEDFNGDGRMDVFVGVRGLDIAGISGGQDLLLLAGQDGRLHDVTGEKLPQLPGGVHWPSHADVDGDGDLDIWVNNPGSDVGAPPYLELNDGTGKFTVVADLGNEEFCSGIDCPIVGRNGRLPEELHGTGSSSAFVDAEGDGDPDLYLALIAGVHVPPGCNWWDFSCAEKGLVFLLNDGTGRFAFAPPDALPPLILESRGELSEVTGVFTHDVNEDGLEDMVLNDSGFFKEASHMIQDKAIQILISNGDGTFRDETYLRLPPQAEAPGGRPLSITGIWTETATTIC